SMEASLRARARQDQLRWRGENQHTGAIRLLRCASAWPYGRAGACRRVAVLMKELGWTAMKARGLGQSGFKEQVRVDVFSSSKRRSPVFGHRASGVMSRAMTARQSFGEGPGDECSAALQSNQARLGMFQKKPKGRCRPWARYHHPRNLFARISLVREMV